MVVNDSAVAQQVAQEVQVLTSVAISLSVTDINITVNLVQEVVTTSVPTTPMSSPSTMQRVQQAMVCAVSSSDVIQKRKSTERRHDLLALETQRPSCSFTTLHPAHRQTLLGKEAQEIPVLPLLTLPICDDQHHDSRFSSYHSYLFKSVTKG